VHPGEDCRRSASSYEPSEEERPALTWQMQCGHNLIGKYAAGVTKDSNAEAWKASGIEPLLEIFMRVGNFRGGVGVSDQTHHRELA